ncbi:hypothetical protein EA187_09245 [Lujinxingia sediminis]|uniref:PD-(D/E)XK nuclease-like domain-containing protein n=1 Tax=Lujinxingia sediminis TaxID=2480984 RepID=A0ABY0CTD1_9DELT|nr:hypothetical protein [Lujinxingia sediminis]RVU44718.1 hypothetical protein EA187_09245 [Lujinxingia sediminis]
MTKPPNTPPTLSHGLMIPWDAEELHVASDSARTATYRRLQSHYREHVLGVGVGCDSKEIPRPNLLPRKAVEENPGLNFLSPEITEYARARLRYVVCHGGTLEEDRLYRNMLSSMPMCFNIFGYWRQYPISAAQLLGELLDLDIAAITAMEVEWIPRGAHPLGDKTAFDAYVEYLTHDNEVGFLGIETKYTEPFSAKEYDRENYRTLTTKAHGFVEGAADVLVKRATNQLWRNLLLVKAVQEAEGFKHGHVVVLALEGDKGAARAVAGVRGQLEAPESCVRVVSLERLVAGAVGLGGEGYEAWGRAFDARYLEVGGGCDNSMNSRSFSMPYWDNLIVNDWRR